MLERAGQPQRRKPVALVVLTGGGFTFETKCLLDALRDDAAFVYLTTEFGGTPGEAGLPPGEALAVPSFASKTRGSALTSLAAFAGTLRAALTAIQRHRVDVVIGLGSSHTVPMLLAGRMRRRRTVYMESITRVDRLSATGQIVYRTRLADQFLVQWPALAAAYPASRLGTIL